MRFITHAFVITAIVLAFASDGVCVPSTALKLCLNSRSGALVSRTTCKSGERALSLASLTTKITEQQGGGGSEFSVTLSDGADADVTIPAGADVPIVGFTAGTMTLSATCASGIVFASSCESSNLTNVSVTRTLSADGKSAQCFWINSSYVAKVGRYYVKLVCADL